MMNILDYKRTLVVIGASAVAVSGACWGYVYGLVEAEKGFNEALETILNEEIEKTRRFYAIKYKDVGPEEFSELDPEDVVVDQQHISIPMEALSTPEGRTAVMDGIREAIGEGKPKDEEKAVPLQVFNDTPPQVNIQSLIEERGPDKPYIISKEEFLRNDANYETYNLTFFEGDGVLIDDKDDVIPDTEGVIGDKHLQLFGVMSDNNNVIYIQNDVTEALFMVTRSFQTAAQALFGVDEEDALEHSNMKRRRPRREDE